MACLFTFMYYMLRVQCSLPLWELNSVYEFLPLTKLNSCSFTIAVAVLWSKSPVGLLHLLSDDMMQKQLEHTEWHYVGLISCLITLNIGVASTDIHLQPLESKLKHLDFYTYLLNRPKKTIEHTKYERMECDIQQTNDMYDICIEHNQDASMNINIYHILFLLTIRNINSDEDCPIFFRSFLLLSEPTLKDMNYNRQYS